MCDAGIGLKRISQLILIQTRKPQLCQRITKKYKLAGVCLYGLEREVSIF
jgi:hypothetical protein